MHRLTYLLSASEPVSTSAQKGQKISQLHHKVISGKRRTMNGNISQVRQTKYVHRESKNVRK
jgi:hypothetical protein